MTLPTSLSSLPDLRDFYEPLIADRGIDNATDFSPKGQVERFAIALECIQSMETKRGRLAVPAILDFGCNVGGLRAYLSRQGMPFTYLGVDVYAPFVERCNQLGGPAVCGNIEDDAFFGELARVGCDYVVASGVMCHAPRGGRDLLWLLRLWQLARRGVVLNFLRTSCESATAKGLRTYTPAKVLEMAWHTGATEFDLRHAYLPNDFTLALYKP